MHFACKIYVYTISLFKEKSYEYLERYKKTKGKQKIKFELRQKGIDDCIIDMVLSEVDNQCDEVWELSVKYILDLRDFPGDPYEDKVVHDVNVILEDPEVTVVCETMGGVEPARTFVLKALLIKN